MYPPLVGARYTRLTPCIRWLPGQSYQPRMQPIPATVVAVLQPVTCGGGLSAPRKINTARRRHVGRVFSPKLGRLSLAGWRNEFNRPEEQDRGGTVEGGEWLNQPSFGPYTHNIYYLEHGNIPEHGRSRVKQVWKRSHLKKCVILPNFLFSLIINLQLQTKFIS